MDNFIDPNYEYDAPMFVDFQSDKGQDEDVDRWFDSKDGDEGGVAFDDQSTEEEEMIVEAVDSDEQATAPSMEPQGTPSSSESDLEIKVEQEKKKLRMTPATNTSMKHENESNHMHTITSVSTMAKPAQTTGSAKKKRAIWMPPRRSMRIKVRSDSTASISSVTSQCSTTSSKGMRKVPKIKLPLTIPSTPECMRRMRSKPPSVLNQKTREEEELDRIAKMQKQMASKRKETAQYMKKALSAQRYMPHRSDEDNHTRIQEFNFATDQRIKLNVQNIPAMKEKSFETTLRQHPPSPSFKNRGITKPVPFQLSGTNLSKKRKEPDSNDDPCGGYESMALSVYKFQKQTPPRFHTKPLKEQNVGPEAITAKERAQNKVTQPKMPSLTTKERKRPLPADCLSREQLEHNELEEMKNYKFKAREFDPRIVSEQGNLGVKPLPRKAITETKPFAFENDPLQQSKPTEEEKPALFKARPAPDFEKVFKPEPTNQSTEVQAFSFETMDKSRFQKKEHKIQVILEEEKKAHSAFHAQLLPSFTPPPQPTSTKPLTELAPFNLSTDNRGAVKAEKWIKKVQDELQEQRTKQVFKAHSSNVVHNAPFKPKKSLKQCTEFEEFGMHSEKRAEEREIYEMQKREREEESNEIERQRKMEQEEQEKLGIAILRKQLVHKSNPIRRFKGVQVQRSTAPLTSPRSPEWQERRKKLRI